MLVMILVFGMTVFGCSTSKDGNDAKLAGLWESEEGPIEFFRDGTGVADGMAFTWTSEKNRLRCSVTAWGTTQTMVYDYKISGSTLTVTDEDGDTVIYTKKK